MAAITAVGGVCVITFVLCGLGIFPGMIGRGDFRDLMPPLYSLALTGLVSSEEHGFFNSPP